MQDTWHFIRDTQPLQADYMRFETVQSTHTGEV